MHAEPAEEKEQYLHLDSSGKYPREVCVLDVSVFSFLSKMHIFKLTCSRKLRLPNPYKLAMCSINHVYL